MSSGLVISFSCEGGDGCDVWDSGSNVAFFGWFETPTFSGVSFFEGDAEHRSEEYAGGLLETVSPFNGTKSREQPMANKYDDENRERSD